MAVIIEVPSKNRRVVQMLWITACVLFVFAFLNSLNSPTTIKAKEWATKATNKVSSLVHADESGRASMRDFMALSEAAWAKSVRQRHEMIQNDYGDASNMPLFPAKSPDGYRDHPYSIWDFTPASYSCPHEMERIGRMGDGGKWVCGMSKYIKFPKDRECIIYSFGVRDESSFENEMLSRTNCHVWAYDFSVTDFGAQLEPTNRPRAHFLQAGIAGKTDKTKEPPFYSIADLMKMNGHEYIDILKMDIEFSEFETMDALSEDFPTSAGQDLPIGQLMVEIHLFHGIEANDYLEWWERLEARGLRPTWTEPNLLAVTLNLGSNFDPLLAKYTMVNVHSKKNILFDGVGEL